MTSDHRCQLSLHSVAGSFLRIPVSSPLRSSLIKLVQLSSARQLYNSDHISIVEAYLRHHAMPEHPRSFSPSLAVTQAIFNWLRTFT